MEKHFNLVDEPWIPVADVGRTSLYQIFSNPEYRALGGNPVQKISLMKLLLAIAQAAVTPANETEWRALGAQGLAEQCLCYLQRWREHFDLYGEQPFLQMPAIRTAALQRYGAVLPEIASGNTTVLNQGQIERILNDADKALLLVGLMGFALGGKKTDNSVTLSAGYAGKRNAKGKPSTGKPGPSVAHMGLLHSFLLGDNIWYSLWLNLLTHEQVDQSGRFPQGVCTPPWEKMPEGEDCAVARQLKASLMGRLLPLCRFCLLTDEGLHYSEGIAHGGYKEGQCDPSAAVNSSGKDPKALWSNPVKRPWRELTALLSFIAQQQGAGFDCLQIRAGLDRARDVVEHFAIWSGGLRVSNNAGEQYASGSDDFVESRLELHSIALGESWFAQLQNEMSGLDGLAKNLYGRVIGYFKEQLVDGSEWAAQATHQFWQLCERDFQQLIDSCEQDEINQQARARLRRRFAGYVSLAYDSSCPKDTARQLDAWAKCYPSPTKYLAPEA